MTAETHHFAYGISTPAIAYTLSVIGSMLGLMCTSRARATEGTRRAGWLGLAAVAIGGTGIWAMHFIAMLGFKVSGAHLRYNVPLTLVSALIAVGVVGVGLFTVGFGGARLAPLLIGGVVTGLGVASMHYTGMAAMNMSGHLSYDAVLVVASVVIAVGAATAALWFTVRVRGRRATFGAALIMGVAVCGMHYTGMAAMRVTLHSSDSHAPAGASAGDFLLPLIVGLGLLATILLVIVSLAPTEAELIDEARQATRVPPEPSRGAVRSAYRDQQVPAPRAPLLLPHRPQPGRPRSDETRPRGDGTS
ncbi:MHYT domain-containing protein [Spirillospora sp. NPDC047279]|uniref:MHYT domain-containing protein n=1 Tax=Spirillospora sp. NPDC047279 TaxID=3155478 RepID=UPI0033E04BAD